VTTSNPRRRLAELTEEIRRAREEIEALLADNSGSSSLFDSSRRLREDFNNVIALDAIRRTEKRAQEAAEPTNAERFAEAMESLFNRRSGDTTPDPADEN
jgi:hypothetical protein